MPRPRLGARVALAAQALVGRFSEGSARAARGLLTGITQRYEPPMRGSAEFLAAYNENPWLQAIISRIAWQTATAQWQLKLPGKKQPGKRRERRVDIQRCKDYGERQRMVKALEDKGEMEVISDHIVLDLLSASNPYLLGSQVRSLTQAWLELVGEAYWIKERNEYGAPVRVWPIAPTWVRSVPTPDTPFFQVSFRGWQGEIPEREILWWRMPDVTNPYTRGVGRVKSLADNVDLEEFATKHQRQWFYNHARPDLIIMPASDGPDAEFEESDIKTLEDRWTKKHRTFWQAFKPFFASKRMEVQQVNQDFASMQLIELRRHERDVMLQNFGVSPETLGIIENSNRATIESADHLFAKGVLVPRLEHWREFLQEALIPEYDDRLIIDYVSPVQEDKEFKLRVISAHPHIAEVDEVRALAGLPEKDDGSGKVHMVSAGLRAVRSLAEAIVEPQPPPAAGNQEPVTSDNTGEVQGGRGGGKKKPPTDEEGKAATPRIGALYLTRTDDLIELDAEVDGVWRQAYQGPVDQHGMVLRLADCERAPALAAPIIHRVSWSGGGLNRWRCPHGVKEDVPCEDCWIEQLAHDAMAKAAGDDDGLETAVHRIADRLTPRMRRDLADAMGKLKDSAIRSRLQQALASGSERAVQAIPWTKLQNQLGVIHADTLRAAFRAVGHATANQLGRDIGVRLSFDITNPRAITWALQNSGRFITEIGDSTRDAVRDLIGRAYAEKLTKDEIARLLVGTDAEPGLIGLRTSQMTRLMNLRAQWAQQGLKGDALERRVIRQGMAMLRRRCDDIARTELVDAGSMGQQEEWSQAIQGGQLDDDRTRKVPIVTWDDRLDTRTCEPMPDMPENQDVRVSEMFTTGDGKKKMAPTYHTKCRCGVRLKFVR